MVGHPIGYWYCPDCDYKTKWDKERCPHCNKKLELGGVD